MRKIRVGVFFGGRSSEHEISVRSAKSVVKGLDKSKYDIVLVGIDKSGRFFFGEKAIALNMPSASQMLADLEKAKALPALSENAVAALPEKIDDSVSKAVDVVFPILHGPYGEDGTIQGLMRLFDVPFVGAGVLGSAIGMDKDVTKRLLKEAGVPIVKYLAFHRCESKNINYDDVVAKLGETVFVKPANLGSSVGINKVKSRDEFQKAVEKAFLYDNKILIEEFAKGREIECSVLGNEYPKASLPGEIVVKRDFYSYSAKYLDDDGADLKIPADLPKEVVKKVQELAVKAFKILCCEGMARVDFFVNDDSSALVNEINTIPGFTEEISMYPKLWEASGLPYDELLDKLIMLAIDRYNRDKALNANSGLEN
ncbi:MAG: D-alanine--D-alanine ligase [Holosporaceae bacterium]|jgi:D-alanine-D-alanine ligase|nr:D-alanine--D-alanine ligase [Holosporaceae bacterium]